LYTGPEHFDKLKLETGPNPAGNPARPTYSFGSLIKWTTALRAKTDTLKITTSTSQLIITSAHYTVIAKELDCEDYL